MKKRVLLSAIALFVAGMFSAQAQYEVLRENPSSSYHPKSFKTLGEVKAPMRAADGNSVSIGYCGDYADALGYNASNITVGAAIKIPSATVANVTGDQLTKVQLGLGTLSAGKKIQLFLTYDLNQDPFYSQEVTPTTVGWNEFTLATPYTIESGKEFYICYTLSQSSNEYPLGLDFASSSSPNNYVYAPLQSGGNQWATFSEVGLSSYGNICIRGIVEGELANFPTNEVTLDDIAMPSVVKVNNGFTIEGQFTNNGKKTVENIDVTYTLGTMASVTKTLTLESPLGYGSSYIFALSDAIIDYEGIDVPVTVSISKVNGVDDEKPADNEQKSTLLSSNTVFDRNVVVEEATGIACGYCPRGIVGMAYMKEKYPDTFIGIAVHKPLQGVSDPMETSSYAYYQPAGLPWSITNRKSEWNGVDPNKEYLEIVYQYERSLPSEAKIDLTARYADDAKSSVDLYSTATFGLDMQSANYRMAYVVLENEVGPYRQTNYFAGGAIGEMGGWENKSSSESTLFDDVARNIFSYNGLENSVPTTIEANKGYEYSCTASLSNVTNTDNIELVAMLLNATSGEIVNAVKIPASAIGAFGGVTDNVADGSVSITAGKGEIRIAGDCDNAAVYGIDGRLVKASAESTINVPAGLYIVKASANGKPTVAKVLVK